MAHVPGFVIWLTGLPNSGKSTLAHFLAASLRTAGKAVEVLDGDEVRQRLSPALGFSQADRHEHVRRLAYVAKLLSRHGVIVIVAAISPYRAARDAARADIGRFVEVSVCCPIEECIRRDVNGLYRKALTGELQHFTGISDPYEPPLSPEVVIETHREPPAQSAMEVLKALATHQFLSPDEASSVQRALA